MNACPLDDADFTSLLVSFVRTFLSDGFFSAHVEVSETRGWFLSVKLTSARSWCCRSSSQHIRVSEDACFQGACSGENRVVRRIRGAEKQGAAFGKK